MLAHPANAAFGGFRIGGILGVQHLAGRHWYDGNSTPTNNVDNVHRLSALSGMYGASAGYLFEIMPAKFVIGGEVYAIIPQANPSVTLQPVNGVIEGTVKIQHTRSIGFGLIVGMMINPKFMAYVNAGLENAMFQFTYGFPKPVVTPTGANFTLPNQTIRHMYKGIVAAIGGSYKIGPHFLIGLEIASPFYKRFKIRTEPPRAYQYKPVERRVVLKFTYLF